MRRVVLMGWIGLGGVCVSGCIGPERATADNGGAPATGVAAPYVRQLPQGVAAGSHAKHKPKLVVHATSATKAEDGRGATVAASDPLALDVHGVLPVRALDPVLHVGALHFHAYTYPDKGVLRFVVADRAALPKGAAVFVQWGTDVASRIPLARALKVPK